MAVTPLPSSTSLGSGPAAAAVLAVVPGFDERWTSWLARGQAHDRTVRRRLTIAAPILAVVTAVLFAWLGGLL